MRKPCEQRLITYSNTFKAFYSYSSVLVIQLSKLVARKLENIYKPVLSLHYYLACPLYALSCQCTTGQKPLMVTQHYLSLFWQ